MHPTTIEERIQMIIEYARKVVMYPIGSKGYDPVDLMNLKYNIEQYDKQLKAIGNVQSMPRIDVRDSAELNLIVNKALNGLYEKVSITEKTEND